MSKFVWTSFVINRSDFQQGNEKETNVPEFRLIIIELIPVTPWSE